jgi:hypothetical protein
MKKARKKIVALLLTFVLVTSLALSAFAQPAAPTSIDKDHVVIISNDPVYTTYGGNANITFRYYSNSDTPLITQESKTTWVDGSLSGDIKKSNLSTSTASSSTFVFVPESEATLVNGTALLVLWNNAQIDGTLAVDDLTIGLSGVQSDPNFTLTPFGENSGWMMDDFADANIDTSQAVAHVNLVYPVTYVVDNTGGTISYTDQGYNNATNSIAPSDKSGASGNVTNMGVMDNALSFTVTPTDATKTPTVTYKVNGGTSQTLTGTKNNDGTYTYSYTRSTASDPLTSATDGVEFNVSFSNIATVSYENGNGGTVAPLPASSTVATNSDVTVDLSTGTKTPDTDMIFAGYTGSDGILYHDAFTGTDGTVVDKNDTIKNIPGDMMLTATWSKDENKNKVPDVLEITFKYNTTGMTGSGESANPADETQAKSSSGNSPAKITDPSASTAYRFTGWTYTGGVGTYTTDQIKATKFSSNTTFTANFVNKTSQDPIRPYDPATDKGGTTGDFVAPGANGIDEKGGGDDVIITPNPVTNENEIPTITDGGNKLELPDGGKATTNGTSTPLPPSVVDTKGNVIDYIYYIRYYEKATTKEVATSKKILVPVTTTDDQTVDKIIVSGYTYDSVDPSLTVTMSALKAAANKTEVKLYYVSASTSSGTSSSTTSSTSSGTTSTNSGNGNSAQPKTGDSSNVLIWALIFGISAAAVGITVYVKNRRKKDN